MLKTVIKHYVIDIGLTAMFDSMVVNFAIGRNFYDSYSPYIDKDVVLLLQKKCVESRGLPTDVITGKLIQVTDEFTHESLKILLSPLCADLLGWDGCIYIYEEDIYKLYA